MTDRVGVRAEHDVRLVGMAAEGAGSSGAATGRFAIGRRSAYRTPTSWAIGRFAIGRRSAYRTPTLWAIGRGKAAIGYWISGIGEEFAFGGSDDLFGGDIAKDEEYHAFGAVVRFHPIESYIR